METRFSKDALFSGMTSNAYKLGTVLSLGWFWMRIAGCSVLYRGPSMESMDFDNLLAVADFNSDIISPPDYLSYDNSSTYFYVVRRVSGCGYQEYTLSAAVKVLLDAEGDIVELQLNKIFSWCTKQADSDKVQLLWYYCPIEQKSKPKYFRIYYDSGTGQIDYENPIATVDYAGRKFYSYLTDSLGAGRYLFAIEAEDANGITDSTQALLKIQFNTINPDTIDILSAKAV